MNKRCACGAKPKGSCPDCVEWPEVTEAQVAAIDKLVAPEFATGDWQTVESEADITGRKDCTE